MSDKELMQQGIVDSDEKASAYMDAKLWDFIGMAAAFPNASPDQRIWDHVLIYAPKQMKQEPECVAKIGNWGKVEWRDDVFPQLGDKLYTAPPKKEWFGLPESVFTAMTLQQVSAMKYAELVLKENNA